MGAVVFLGTPEPAVIVLRALVAAGIDVPLVVSRPDRRRGRGATMSPSPVKAAAVQLGLPVSERVADAIDTGAELAVVVAYGRIIARPVLEALPMVNLHFSLLPRWRGAAPVERAVLAGDPDTGVCLMALEESLDTGGVYRRAVVAIDEQESVDALRTRLAGIGATMLVEALRGGLGEAVAQQGEVTYAAKIDPAELHLDWTQPAVQLARTVRLGRAWTTWRAKRLLVTQATVEVVPDQGEQPGDRPARVPGQLVGDVVVTGDGGLRLLRVQPEGRSALSGRNWLNGARPAPGEALGR